MRLLLCAAALALAVGACSTGDSPVAGGSSTVDNPKMVALRGSARYASGAPAVGAWVAVRAIDFLASASDTLLLLGDVTDDQGWYEIDSLDTGAYRVEINDRAGMACLVDIQAVDDTTLPEQTLAAVAAVQGSVVVAGSTAGAYVHVYGMQRVAPVAAGEYSFDDLPAGDYVLRVVSTGGDIGRAEVDASALGEAESRTLPSVTLARFGDEDYTAWAYSASVGVNTAQSGAGVGDDVFGFPLLVRLNASSLTGVPGFFQQADPRGYDLRFAGLGGTPLRYEIEQWDPATQEACVWVLIDTVRGNDSSQSITMYWGAAGAQDFSSGPAVFDTALGYSAVYHLGENPATYGTVADHTPNTNHAEVRGTMVSANRVNGVVGSAMHFDGVNDVLVGSGPYLALYTFSFWVNAAEAPLQCRDSLQSRKVLSYGHSNFEFDWDHNYSDFVQSHAHQIRVDDSTVSWRSAQVQTALSAGNWYHVAGTYDGTVMSVYLDGVLEQATSAGMPDSARADWRLLAIGGYRPFDRCFRGEIDEVRISYQARSAAWTKLEHGNQKPDQRLVRIVP